LVYCTCSVYCEPANNPGLDDYHHCSEFKDS
jgi:hypothetical protein